jgi:hypothetical protein
MQRVILALSLLLCAGIAAARDKYEIDVRAIDSTLTKEKDGRLEFDIRKQTFKADSDYGKFTAPLSDISGMELERRGERNYLRIKVRLKTGETDYFFVLKEDSAEKVTRRLTELQQDTKVAIKGL